MLATLIGLLGDFELAEEAAQQAFAVAAERWPADGVPSNTRAWLITTARRRAVDRLRSERTFQAKAAELRRELSAAAGGRDPHEAPMMSRATLTSATSGWS